MKKVIILLGVVGTSLSGILVRYADAPSELLVFYRMLFAMLLLTPVAGIWHGTEINHVKAKDLVYSAISGIFLGLHFMCYFEGIRRTSISSAAALVDTEVFFVSIGGVLFLKEKLPWKSWCFIAITFIGSMIIALGDWRGGGFIGDILALSGAISSSVYTLIGRKVRSSMSTTLYTWIVYFFAAVIALAGTWGDGLRTDHIDERNLLIAFALAVFCTLLGHSVFCWGLKYEPASFVSTAKLLEPVFASTLGIFLFQELPSFTSCMGALLIILGIVLLCRADVKAESN